MFPPPTSGAPRERPPLHHEVADKFLEFLNQYPEKPAKAGLMGNIAGIATAFRPGAMPNDVDEARFGNYHRKRDEWSKKAGVLSTAANTERLGNEQVLRDEDRDFVNSLRAEDLVRKTKEGEANIAIKNKDAETRARRAAIQEEGLNGGKIYYHSGTGKAMLLTRKGDKVELDPDDFKGLTFEQTEKLKTAGALKIVEARGDIQKEIEKDREAARLAQIEAEKKAKLETDAAKAGGTESGASEKAKLQLRIQQYVREHPQHADWLDEDETSGAITMKPKIRPWDSATTVAEKQKAIKDFNEFVKGGASKSPGETVIPGSNTGTVTPVAKPSRFGSKTSIQMLARDGKTVGTVSSEAEARRLEGLKPPYTRVKK